MVTTVCLNPCVDKTVEIDGFAYGSMNRVLRTKTDAGGKGTNVAVACKRLGLEANCVGILYENNSETILSKLEREGIEGHFLRLSGSVRTNTKLYDRNTHVTTEINEPGEQWQQDTLSELLALVERAAKRSEYVVLSGSLPQGCPQDIYAQMIRLCGKQKCVVDTEGEKLVYAAKEGPLVVKCNLYELELACGRSHMDKAEIARQAGRYLEQGVKLVLVTMGEEGMLAFSDDEALYVPAAPCNPVRTVGAGDAAAAGLIYAFSQGEGFSFIVRSAAAAAAAAIVCEQERMLDADEFEKQLDIIKPEKIDDCRYWD